MPCVPGRHVCRLHGAFAGRPAGYGKHYLANYHIPEKNRALFQDFMNDSAWADLGREIALLRTMVQEYTMSSNSSDPIAQAHASRLMSKIGELVATKHKIEYGEKYTININTLVAYAARIGDIINEFVPNDDDRSLVADRIEKLFAGMELPYIDPIDESRLLIAG